MRYLAIWLLTFIASALQGVLFTQVQIFGLTPDIMLITMIAMMLNEKTLTPMFATVFYAVFLDALYARAIGYYSLPYAIVGLIVYLILQKAKINIFISPLLFSACAWVLKDMLMAAITFFMGIEFDFWAVVLSKTLPELLLNGILGAITFFIYKFIYSFSFIRPQRLDED